MLRKVVCIGGHGLGDCLLSFQCAEFALRKGEDCDVWLSTREEIYKPIHWLFTDRFNLKLIPEGLNEETVRNASNPPQGYEDFFYTLPDWLFNNPKAFDWRHYQTSPHVIKTTRLLTHKYHPSKLIYLGLMTSTPGYFYPETEQLALNLAKNFPDYTIYVPLMSQWAGSSDIEKPSFTNAPSNLVVEEKDLISSLDVLRKAEYFIGTCNGPSHVAYQLGMPRIILDPQYNKLPWMARWKEDVTESIPITSSWPEVSKVVQINLRQPETSLIPRSAVLANIGAEWKRLLLNKF